jgi:CRP-like cAMP-binding protein
MQLLHDKTNSFSALVGVRAAAVLHHLASFGGISEEENELLAGCLGKSSSHEVGHELIAAGTVMEHPRFVLSGWVGSVCILADGRRQILDLLFAGDLAGYSSRPGTRAKTSFVCLTPVVCCSAGELAGRVASHGAQYPGLASAFRGLEDEAEDRLIAQIVRNGRMLAHERISDLLLSLHRRHERAGTRVGDGFLMPLTQEMLGDALGLSTVHINRIIQQLKREGVLRTNGTRWEIPDLHRLAAFAGGRQ